ncbi:HAD-IB family phosphatase [candidate division KSB1 bacterium]|nr:HAD-IB family phosphatase [candidate division KSB1 bacterium]
MMVTINNSDQAQAIAVFDVDWTLLCGTSAESLLVEYLKQKKIIPFRNVLKTVILTFFRLPHGILFSFLKNKYYLHDIEMQTIQDVLPAFYESILQPALSQDLLQEMEDLRKKDYAIYLVSGTLDFIVEFLILKLDATGGAGSRVEIKNGKLTGRLLGHYPVHREKVLILKQLLKGKKVDWEKSICFGDSYFDIPLLSLFGNVVAVHPDFGLRKEAIRRGWRIVTRRPRIDNPLFRIWTERFFRKA